MRNRRHLPFVILGIFLTLSSYLAAQTVLPGREPDGRVLLPNGWYLSPAGKQLELGDLPLNMDIAPDGKYVAVANNGMGKQTISVVDTRSWQVIQNHPIGKSWVGIRFTRDGKSLFVSGGNDDWVVRYAFLNGVLTPVDTIVVGRPWPKNKIWVAGLDVDREARRLFVVGRQSHRLYVFDLASKKILKELEFAADPYTCLVSRDNSRLYVSLWGGSGIAFVDLKTLEVVKTVKVGDHPCDMVEAPDGKRLYVANANLNTVSVVDVANGRVAETVCSAITPDAPPGSTPNGVALSPDGNTLYIANADNNSVAVFNVSRPGVADPMGFIPVGWYPTCVRVLGSGEILVSNGKGGTSLPNPRGPNPEVPDSTAEYIGTLFQGTLSVINPPSSELLLKYTQQVYANTRFSRSSMQQAHRQNNNPVPSGSSGSSPIKHVFYVIKENRTYDQVFGDIKEGNGDAALCLFPDSVTPNHHALAREFVLLDNFYVDAEVSADGHNWSTAAYATDYVEKSWPTQYSRRGGDYEYEGGSPIASPSSGYIWDNCRRHGASYRTYGEFVENPARHGDSARAHDPGLEGHVAPFYWSWDLDYSDVERAKEWKAEFDAYDRDGGLPQFQIIKLPNDHTYGTRRGKLTPKAYVAQNDLALGMIVDRISHSRYWKESAIFVLEDDAQNGPDHVDAHRSIALVVSPYTRRHFVDHEMYSTSGMIRTMELILGLPPMTQFDASATPMFKSFTPDADFTPYTCRSASYDLNEKNMAGAYGQKRSGEMNFAREDAIPDVEFSEIIWKSVRGADSEMPAPVRSAFVRVIDKDEDGE